MLKITSIHIDNFRGIKHVNIDALPPSVFLTGPNGAGKSSILDAVRLALSGTVSDQAGRRSGTAAFKSAALIGPHDKESYIKIGITGPYGDSVISCNLHSKGMRLSVSGVHRITGKPPEVRASLYGHHNIDPTHAAVALNPRNYLYASDLGEMLAELDGGKIDDDALKRFAGEYHGWLAEWLGRHKIPCETTHDLAVIGEAAMTERRVVNRQLDELDHRVQEVERVDAPANPKTGETIEVDQLPAYERQLETLRKQRDTLIEERGAASRSRSKASLDKEIAKAQERHDKAHQAMEEANRALEEAQRIDRNLADQIQSLTHECSHLRGDMDRLQNEVDRAQKTVDSWAELSECPTCGGHLSDADRERIEKPLRASLDELQAGLDSANDRHEEKQTEIKTLTENRDGAKAQVKQAQETYAAKYRAFQDAQSALDQLKREQPARRSTDEIQREIDDIESRIDAGEKLVEQLRKYAERVDLETRIEALKKEKLNLDWACDAFDKGRAQNELGGGGRKLFTDSCNEVLDGIGYTLAAEVRGKDVQLHATRPDGQRVPLSLVSDGEQLLYELAVGAAFANGGPLLLDNLDGLDGWRKRDIWRTLAAVAADRAGTILCAGAWGLAKAPEMQALAGALKPTGIVWVQDGTASEVSVVPEAEEETEEATA